MSTFNFSCAKSSLILTCTRKSLPNKLNMYALLLPFLSKRGRLIGAQNADNDLWEANRMVTSGVATRKGVDLDFEDESQSAVHVMVHHLKPPFLDGRTVFTKQLDPINPIRDPTSDMAVFAKKGSALVKEKREQAERAKAAAKLAALGGTSLGNILGVKDEEAEAEGARSFARFFFGTACSPSLSAARTFAHTATAEAQAKNGTKEDYKGDSKFASHLKTSAGVSSFARNRTLREQREYLPAFACREDLLRTVRDHQGAVVLILHLESSLTVRSCV
jgi:pre-mRNA-splicing factor ATP-dependent RNA helicase DHX38/PRP16